MMAQNNKNTYYLQHFLKVENAGLTWLSGSGLGSLGMLQSRRQLGLPEAGKVVLAIGCRSQFLFSWAHLRDA